MRTSLSLAALTGRSVRLERIRAGRSRPGLMAARAGGLLSDAGLRHHVKPLRERAVAPGAGLFLWISQAGVAC